MLKTWPCDAVILVCATPSEARIELMGAAIFGHCRDCGRGILCSERSHGLAMASPLRYDRPIDFLCVECCVQYDIRTMDRLIDHRGGKDEVVI
jgi:hypothetical protein